MKRRRSNQHGMAMLIVIGLLLVFAISTSAFFSLLNRTLSAQYASNDHSVCLNLAEAGIDRAVAELSAGRKEFAGEKDVALGSGFYTVEVKPDSAARWTVSAAGFLRNGNVVRREARLSAVVDSTGGTPRIAQWTEVHP